MPLRVARTLRADLDLHEIWSFIADQNETAADKLILRFDRAFRTLAAHPEAGAPRPELWPGLRSLSVGGYLLFYSPGAEILSVVRVLSARRDITSEMFEDA